MENKISLVITAVVAIIMIGALLMPIINDAGSHNVSYTNEEGQKEFVLSDSFTLSGGLVNDVSLGTLTPDFGLVVSDQFVAVAYGSGSEWGLWSYLTKDGQNVQGSLTVTDGEYTINSATPISGTLEWALIPAVNGTHSFYNTGTSFVATLNDTVYTVANSSANYGVTFGSIADQTTAFKVVSGESTPSYVAELVYSAIDDTNAFEVEGRTSDNAAFVIAPIDVTYSAELNDSASGLLYAIPVLLIVGLLVMFVARIRS